MSFLIALLLPVIATTLYFRRYPERAAARQVPAHLSTTAALRSGALTGAAALVFLGVLGAVVLIVRGRALTPESIDTSPVIFWATQFVLTALIGAAVGALTALALLSSVRGRLAQSGEHGSE